MGKIPLGTRRLYRGNQHGTIILSLPSVWIQTVEAAIGDSVTVTMLPGNVLQIQLLKESPGKKSSAPEPEEKTG